MTSNSYPQRRPLGHGRIGAGDAPVEPRDAGTLIVWREGPEGTEVLMGRRSRRAAFVPDFFVFPGGRLDAADRLVRAATPLDPDAVKRMGVRGDVAFAEALALAAVRETYEETGLLLAEIGDPGDVEHVEWAEWRARGLAPGLHRLRYFGRAITSESSPIRFHARFFVARAGDLQGDLGGSGELSELGFYPATEVLAHMPVVDVTEFMLNRIIAYAHDPLRFDPRAPIFSYRDDAPFVRYE
ncbi:MAG: NUDIX hydrolase [Rhodospirillaceae bacterium]|nr:NUDIX hydrolase [Rhodospirillaceae bacterium]